MYNILVWFSRPPLIACFRPELSRKKAEHDLGGGAGREGLETVVLPGVCVVHDTLDDDPRQVVPGAGGTRERCRFHLQPCDGLDALCPQLVPSDAILDNDVAASHRSGLDSVRQRA